MPYWGYVADTNLLLVNTLHSYKHHITISKTYEGGGLHSAINLGTTVSKWNLGKKPDKPLCTIFFFLACLEKTMCHHPQTKNNNLHGKKKNKQQCMYAQKIQSSTASPVI